jgi:molybdopterin molybdotransferase
LCGRAGATEWETIPLAGALPQCGDRETFVRARRTVEGALPIANQDSSAQRALVAADLLLRSRPHDRARDIGEILEALAF